jgi:hypothetical protein
MVQETVGEDDSRDLSDGTIEVEFTGEINPHLCLRAMSDALRNALEDKEEKLITGKLTDIFFCT